LRFEFWDVRFEEVIYFLRFLKRCYLSFILIHQKIIIILLFSLFFFLKYLDPSKPTILDIGVGSQEREVVRSRFIVV